MRNRYPLFLAPRVLFWLFVFCYAIAFATAVGVAWSGHVSIFEVSKVMHGERPLTDLVLIAAAAFYGANRATAFHPVQYPAYRNWLKMSPWQPGKPLPIMPLHWVWQDALAVGVLCGLAIFHRSPHPADVLIAFGASYLLLTATFLDRGKTPVPAALLMTGLPVLLFSEMGGWYGAAVVAAVYPIAATGIAAMLRRFPWDEQQKVSPSHFFIGWPFSVLKPTAMPPRHSSMRVIVSSVLTGWWSYALLQRVWPPTTPEYETRLSLTIVLFVGVATFAFRAIAYLAGHAPPINILGRIVTGHLIIPGFDKIWIAPLTALAASGALPWMFREYGMSLPAVVGLSLPVVFMTGTLIGPSLSAWKLTGHHRATARRQPVRNVGAAAGAVGG